MKERMIVADRLACRAFLHRVLAKSPPLGPAMQNLQLHCAQLPAHCKNAIKGQVSSCSAWLASSITGAIHQM